MSKKIPILFNHDYSQIPVGYLDTDGKIQLRPSSGVTPEMLCDLNVGYIPHKVAEDGTILEAQLVELSLVVKK